MKIVIETIIITALYIGFIHWLSSCAEDEAPPLIQIEYGSSFECRNDLYPQYGPDEFYDKVDALCGVENLHEGPEY